MGRYLDRDLVEDFIKDNFKSRKDFVSKWGISYSHFFKDDWKQGDLWT